MHVPCRTGYTHVVHCGSVRQAAHVLHMTEMRSPGGTAIEHVHGVSLAPAVAAAAALLCPSASGVAHVHPVILKLFTWGPPSCSTDMQLHADGHVIATCKQKWAHIYTGCCVALLRPSERCFMGCTCHMCVWLCYSGGAAAAAHQRQ